MLISEMNMESILLVTNFRAVDGGWSVRSRARVGRQICATQPAAFYFILSAVARLLYSVSRIPSGRVVTAIYYYYITHFCVFNCSVGRPDT